MPTTLLDIKDLQKACEATHGGMEKFAEILGIGDPDPKELTLDDIVQQQIKKIKEARHV